MWYDDQAVEAQLNPRERIAKALLNSAQGMAPEDDSPWASLGRAANQIAGAFVNKRINDRLAVRDKVKPVPLKMF